MALLSAGEDVDPPAVAKGETWQAMYDGEFARGVGGWSSALTHSEKMPEVCASRILPRSKGEPLGHGSRHELFDLRTDPEELNDLHGQPSVAPLRDSSKRTFASGFARST